MWAAYETDRIKEVSNTERFGYAWKALSPHFGHRLGKALTRDDCRTYAHARKAQGRSDSTIRSELGLLSACLKFSMKDAAPKLWRPPASKPRAAHLTKEQFKAFLTHASAPHAYLFMVLAAATVARRAAILNAKWQDVSWERRQIDYRPAGRHSENKLRSIVPLNTHAFEALQEAHRASLTDYVIEHHGKPVKCVRRAFLLTSQRSGIKCTPHMLRHSGCVWMAEANIPMEKISQYAGHSSVKETEKTYARFSPDYMRDAAEATSW
jgi:integrase